MKSPVTIKCVRRKEYIIVTPCTEMESSLEVLICELMLNCGDPNYIVENVRKWFEMDCSVDEAWEMVKKVYRSQSEVRVIFDQNYRYYKQKKQGKSK
jgi:hypothetical protein